MIDELTRPIPAHVIARGDCPIFDQVSDELGMPGHVTLISNEERPEPVAGDPEPGDTEPEVGEDDDLDESEQIEEAS